MSSEISKELTIEGNTLVEQSKELMVIETGRYILKSEKERNLAAIFLKEAHALEKKIEDHYKPIEDAHRETGRKIKEAKDSQLSGPQEAKKILSQGIGEFDEKKRCETKKIIELEKERIKEERLKEAEKRLNEARKLKEQGTPESIQEALNIENEVEEFLDLPIPDLICCKQEKLSGIRQMKIIKCKLENEDELKTYLVEQIMQGKVDFFRFLKVNESRLRTYTKVLDGKVNMPGWKVWEEFKASSTGR